jgi:hypothetical protein
MTCVLTPVSNYNFVAFMFAKTWHSYLHFCEFVALINQSKNSFPIGNLFLIVPNFGDIIPDKE